MDRVQHIDTYVFGEAVRNESNFADGIFYMLSDRSVLPGLYNPGVPFRPITTSCIRIIRGHAEYIMNLVSYSVRCGDILLVPENSIFEVVSVSDDLSIELFSFATVVPDFSDLPLHVHIEDTVIWQRLGTYYSLMREHAEDNSMQKVSLLQLLYIEELKPYSSKETLGEKKDSRGARIFKAFIQLVNRHSGEHRRVEYYADLLALTPNWLSNVIKNYSGKTVMQWINISVIQQAKAALVYSDKPVKEIAYDLNFSSLIDFSRFFRRETGISPSEYRKSLISNR